VPRPSRPTTYTESSGNTNLCLVTLEDDKATTRPVAVINEAFARRFFKNEKPLGKHFGPDKIQMRPGMKSSASNTCAT
jgi:hypothetical protein